MAHSVTKPNKSFLEQVHSEIQECSSNECVKDLLTINNDILLYWSEVQKCIYSINLSKFMLKVTNKLGDDKYQILRTSVSPLFDVSSIKCSRTGHHALVYGEHGIGVVELPRMWGEDGIYEGGKAVIHCKMTILDESFYTHYSSLKILQVQWYSGSPNNTHVVVLTNDNSIRFYDTCYPEQPILRLSLFNVSGDPYRSSSCFSGVCGETAIDFDIALPKIDKNGNAIYPIYIMQESGDVWVLYCKFAQNRLQVEHQGPLIMNPPSQDNYGCDYSSLLCMETTPTTIMMASKKGVIHHCLVLEDTDDSQNDPDGILVKNSEALYVYESVQLDLTLLPSAEQENEPNTSHLLLKKDKNRNDCYTALSNGGVHFINLPWIEDLNVLLANDADCEDVAIEIPAEVSYLLCTQPSSNSLISAITGCVFAIDSSLLCLLNSGEFTKLSIPRLSSHVWEAPKSTSVSTFHSPLRQLRGTGSFDVHIAKILKRNSTLPLIRCAEGNRTLPADEYYKLLTTTTQILREEYLQKMMHAKIELEKRIKILTMKKEEQIAEINSLKLNLNLDEASENLAVKLEIAQENMQRIVERLGVVRLNIRSSAAVLSNEEKEWHTELKQTNEKLNKLRRLVEAVKSKQQDVILKTIPRTPTKTVKSDLQNNLSASQLIKIRRVLKEQEINIAKLVEETNSLSLKLST